VLHEGVAGLPSWLVGGVLLGLGGSLLVALFFLGAQRLLPGGGQRDGRRQRGDQSARGSGESRRRREFRACLEAIGEPYAENHRLAGQDVAFFLPERDVAITFDPRVYYRIEGSGVEPLLAEHEMPGSVLVERLPFETPDLGTVGGSEVPPARDAFAELGVPAGASIEEVRRAYRRRVKEVHPDQGGDEDAFRRVREAYVTAKEHAE